MDLDDLLKETLEQLLIKLGVEYSKINVIEEEKDNYLINLESPNASLLIGYHGANIQALQHLLKTLCWKKAANDQFNIMLDIDGYRQRQEENVLNLAQRKIDTLRKTRRPQTMPPMSAYFRRKVHMLCMGAGFEDIETISQGDGEQRHIILKLK